MNDNPRLTDTDLFTRRACTILLSAADAIQGVYEAYLHTPDVYDPTLSAIADLASTMKSTAALAKIVASYRVAPR